MLHKASRVAFLAGCVTAFMLSPCGVVAQQPRKEDEVNKPQSPDERKRDHQRAWALYMKGDAEAAEEAIKLWTRLHGNKDWRVGWAQSQLEDMGPSLAVMANAEKLRKSMEAMQLVSQATAALEQDPDVAAVKASKAMEILAGIGLGDTNIQHAILDLLAEAHLKLEHYSESQKLWEQVIAAREKKGRENWPQHANALSRLGVACTKKAEYASAKAAFERANRVFGKLLENEFFPKEAGGVLYRTYGLHLSGQGVYFASIGDYAKAANLYQRAAIVHQQIPALPPSVTDYGFAVLNQSELLLKAGLVDPLLERKKLVKVKEALRGAADKLAPYPGPRQQLCRAQVLNTLSTACMMLGEHAEAGAVSREALATAEKWRRQKPELYAELLSNSQFSYLSEGNLDEAEKLARESAQLLKEALGARHPHYEASLSNLSFIRSLRGDAGGAHQWAKEALETSFALTEVAVMSQNERQQILFVDRLFHDVKNYLGAALAADMDADQVYRRVIGWKGVASSRQMEQRLTFEQPELRPLLAELSDVRAQLLTQWLSVPKEGEASGRADKIRVLVNRKDEIEHAIAEKSSAFRGLQSVRQIGPEQIAKALPAGAVFIDVFPYIYHVPKEKPDPKLPFPLNVARIKTGLVAFVVRPEVRVERVQLGDDQGGIKHLVPKWRKAILARDKAAQRAVEKDLVPLLWEPLEPYVRGASVVVVCPDALLSQVPLGALPGRNPDTYLIEDVPVSYVSSARQLIDVFGKGVSDVEPSLFAAGGIDYGPRPPSVVEPVPPALQTMRVGLPFEPFGPLAGARNEARAVRKHFESAFPNSAGRASLLEDDAPSKERLKKEFAWGGKGQRYVHLATHGYFAGPERAKTLQATAAREASTSLFSLAGDDWLTNELTTTLLSGIALAGANGAFREEGPDGGGILTAEEIGGLDLRGSELVVLSACHSGRGKEHAGEGVVGLQRAFHLAGARSVVAALWQADDRVTELLMDQFYSNLWEKKLGPLQALRQAQIDVLHHGPGSSDQPYDWAVFVFSGAPGDLALQPSPPLPEPASSTPPTGVVTLLLIVGGVIFALTAGLIAWRLAMRRHGQGAH